MIRQTPSEGGLWAGWAEAGPPVRVRCVMLGLAGIVALAVQAVSVLYPASRGWSAELAWVVAGVAACAATIMGGLRVRGRPVTLESYLLWGVGVACWTVAVLVASGRDSPKADSLFLVLPLICIFTYFRRVPRTTLFLLFMLDAIPVVLLIVALTLILHPRGREAVYAGLFTGLYVTGAANAIQMIGIHSGLRNMPRTWVFTLAFCIFGIAALPGQPPAASGRDLAAGLFGTAWTLGLVTLTFAGMSRMLQPSVFVTLLPEEKQTGPHAIPPTAAVFGLILLLVVTPENQQAMLRGFLLSAAVVLVVRISLVYRQDVRLIEEVVGSRERLRMLAEVTSKLKSLVLDELLETFCQSARDVLGAQYAAFGVAEDGPGFARMVTAPGGGPDGHPLPIEPPGRMLRPDRPVRLAGPTRDSVVAGFRSGRPQAEGFLCVPVTVGGANHGTLYLAGKPGGFTEEDVSLAELLAINAGYTIVNAALYAESQSQQEQLAEQNERLRGLDKLKDEFIALVSHELRTPLASIIGYVELLRDDEVDTPEAAYQQFAKIIDRNAHRLLRLVGDLLFLSHIQTGKMEMEIHTADLTEIAARAVEESQPRANSKNISLVLSATPAPPLLCDPERMAQVLDNLITNAVKFTPEGGQVEVMLRDEGDGVALAVRDTGIGISGADQERIFEGFYRSASVTKRQIAGTGLGLTITKAIIDAHNGTITVDSQEGNGTTFRIWIPRDPALASEAGITSVFPAHGHPAASSS